ncbi:inactivation no afterpotential E isoform X2 [Tachypleus tridentatus]|uniref:inactivation no afterpotential E isoform X2 n=1 Tax=Tachypleus tridentatus TaxID=6853 RepID=UPI003FD03F56
MEDLTMLVVLSVILTVVDFGQWSQCMIDLYEHVLGYIVILTGCIIVEGFISWISMRGTILDNRPRVSMQYLLYVRLGILLVEVAWLIVGVVWISRHYHTCPMNLAKEAILGIVICNWCVLLSVVITIWCTFDAAGRSWVKMKRYQRSLREDRSKYRYKRSGSSHRNWRHRKAMREYQDSWNRRCRLLFCCIGRTDRHQNSFAEIAKLLSEFFRDLDVVPSDVVAGLVLLRKYQRMERQAIVKERTNETYQFLSGVPITPKTKFLDINHPLIIDEILTITHYLHYALAVYGWPMFMMVHSGTCCCKLFPYLKCCCIPGRDKSKRYRATIVEDNCCYCNYAALQKMCLHHNMEIVYVTFHVEVGETPFLVALDHERRTVVVSIRGTISLQDVITDLNADGEQLPTDSTHEDWLGHKGMVLAAVYIRRKLVEEGILTQAFRYSPEKGTSQYDLVLVGHSLGAGTAAILAILLKQDFPNLVCYAYSPPGGLLSWPAVEYSKQFITSVVMGKDVVPRLGLHQLESLRSDLINAIKRTEDPKWKIIMGGVMCCCPEDNGVDGISVEDFGLKSGVRDVTTHPSDSSIALTAHQPMYPPGRIIHIIRNHPRENEKLFKKQNPVFQAIWADNTDFDEVLISPVMVQDHMPDKVMEALEKLLVNTGPPKPQRTLTELERRQLLTPSADTLDTVADRTPPHRLVLETSFTDLNPESLTGTEEAPTGLRWEYSSAIAATMESGYSTRQMKSSPSGVQPGSNLDGHLKVDLLHDDWLGLAPLASPETLSDVSSISSKGSSQRLNNGNHTQKLSWGGINPLEPIAQSPAVQRPLPDSIGVYYVQPHGPEHQYYGVMYSADETNVNGNVDRDTSTANLLDNSYEQGDTTPLGQKVVTEVTVEMQPFSQCHSNNREISKEHNLHLKLEPTSQETKCSITQSSNCVQNNGGEKNIDRQSKRVTFELCSSQDSHDSTNGMKNDGDSFVPSYPEYSTQQEYGNHEYMYSRFSCTDHTPLHSPTLEYSMPDAFLTKMIEKKTIHRSFEEADIYNLEDTANVFEVSTLPVKVFHNQSSFRLQPTKEEKESRLLETQFPSKMYRKPPTESSL